MKKGWRPHLISMFFWPTVRVTCKPSAFNEFNIEVLVKLMWRVQLECSSEIHSPWKNVRGQHHYNIRGVFVTPEVCAIVDLQVAAKSVAKLNENLIHGKKKGRKRVCLLDCSTRNFIPCRNTIQTFEWKFKIPWISHRCRRTNTNAFMAWEWVSICALVYISPVGITLQLV